MTVAAPHQRMPAGTADRVVGRLFPETDPFLTDPVSWIERTLGEQLWSKQREIAESVRDHRLTAVKSCHGAGKSYLASRVAAWWIGSHPRGEAFVVTTAPSQHQVKVILWREINRAHQKGELPGRITRGQVPDWSIDGETVAFGRKTADSSDPDEAMASFQGIHARYLLVILDEAAGVPPWLYDSATTLTTGDDDRILAIGNPDKPSSRFAEICAPGTSWNVVSISAFETPRFTGEPVDSRIPLVSQAWIEQQVTQPGWAPGSPLYTSRVLGEFPDSDVDLLFPPALIRRAHEADLPGSARGGYAADVSRFGDAETVVYRNRDGVIRLEAAATKQDTEETADQIFAVVGRWIPIAVDGVGVGGGVVDKLRARGAAVIDFNAGERAHDPARFVNRRAETFWALRELMEDGLIDLDPDDKELARQLQQIRYWHTPAGKVQIESKETMVKRGVKSPDRADAAAMTMAIAPEWVIAKPDPAAPAPETLTSDLLERAL